MKQAIFVLTPVILLLGSLFVWSLTDLKERKRRWLIVKNQKGEFSFTDWSGRVILETFKTESEARVAMLEKKQWSDEYDQAAEKRQSRQSDFKPIK